MTISLEKLNRMYNQARDMGMKLQDMEDQFKEDTQCEDYSNPFHLQSQFNHMLTNIKSSLSSFLIRRYQDAFCPNIPVYNYVLGHNNWFEGDDFDAVKFVEKINEVILGNPEKLAYDNLRKEAKNILRFDIDKTNLSSIMHKNMIRGHSFLEYGRVSHCLPRHMDSFEKFVRLILDNQNVFSRVAPTQIKCATPISIAMETLRPIPPTTIYACGPYISEVSLFKNGRIDFKFNKKEECLLVAKALAGEPPDVPFPEQEIDVNRLFTFESEHKPNKRVVKRG